jgi:hypothetical protein
MMMMMMMMMMIYDSVFSHELKAIFYDSDGRRVGFEGLFDDDRAYRFHFDIFFFDDFRYFYGETGYARDDACSE